MRSQVTRKNLSATNARNLRTLLLLNVFEPEEIGGRIKQARERAGLRQEDLADLIEVSNRTVQNYEAGETKPFAKLKAVAAATGVTVEWLLHGDPEQPAAQASSTEIAGLRAEIAEIRELVERVLDRLDGPPARAARR